LNGASFVYGRLKLTLLLVVALLLPVTPSWGQAPSVLEEMKLVTEDQSQAAFILRFSPQEPRVETARTDPAAVTVLIRNTLRSPQMPGSFRYGGLVRAVEFQSNRPDLAVRFLTSSPARVSIEPAENNVILIKVQKVTGDEAIGSRPLGSSDEPVVKASDLSQPILGTAAERYEMIFLRYADVSEVIGLLGDGVSIEPNNTFIRREPGFGSLGANSQSSFLQPQTQEQKPGPPLGQILSNGLGADRRLNAIWVTGTPERIERILEREPGGVRRGAHRRHRGVVHFIELIVHAGLPRLCPSPTVVSAAHFATQKHRPGFPLHQAGFAGDDENWPKVGV